MVLQEGVEQGHQGAGDVQHGQCGGDVLNGQRQHLWQAGDEVHTELYDQ